MDKIIKDVEKLFCEFNKNDIIVLDIGTGSANMAISLSEMNIQSITIEKNQKAIKIATNEIQKSKVGKRPVLLNMDVRNMDFMDETFDIVVAYKSLHHIKNADIALKEMYRVCKNKGKIIIVEHSQEKRKAIDFINHIKKIEHPKEITVNDIKGILSEMSGNIECCNKDIGEMIILNKYIIKR